MAILSLLVEYFLNICYLLLNILLRDTVEGKVTSVQLNQHLITLYSFYRKISETHVSVRII